ncbi:MAG: aryl-sulfate sulfotransferase [Atopostipes sp.]|nr:aryl-sulfate sulfotransferase [Atopostipes sp.]
MTKKKISSLLLTISLVTVLGACSITDDSAKTEDSQTEEEVYEPEPDPEASQISSYNHDFLDDQKAIEKEIQKDYEKGSYNLEDPFVKLDPYDAAPLSALIIFETEEASSIQLTIGLGKDEEVISKNFDEEKKKHELPVLGLYPDKENTVKIEATNSRGETEETKIKIKTDALPQDFMKTELINTHPENMENGLTFMVPNIGTLYAVDSNADVRWYSSIKTRIVFNKLKNGHYLQTAFSEEDENYKYLMERDFLGKLYHAYNIEVEDYDGQNIIHHDVVEMASGNFLATTHEPNSKYVEDHMHEIDRETGITTQEMNVRDSFPEKSYTEYDGKNADNNDWLHQNAIWPDDDGKSILISGRSQDAILKLDYPTGDIEWILAANEDWPEEYQDYLLEPIGEVDFPAGQHAVKVIDNPEIEEQEELKDIILFDNNALITRGDKEASGQYSQAIRYRINEKEKTVEQTWDYGKEHGEDFHSSIIGNVQYLYEQDNIILNSGAIDDEKYGTDRYGKIVEVDALDNDSGEIFEVDVYGSGEAAGNYIYRAYRYPLYSKEWNYELAN